MASNEPRVRPISGIIALLLGVLAGIFYVKGYRSAQFSLRLLHLVFACTAFFWGLKTSVMGGKRWRSDGWVGRLVPYRIEVTREGWLYFTIMVTVLMGALIGRSNMLLLVFGLLAGPFVLNGYIALSMLSHNVVKRQLPERVMQGDWFSVDMTLINRRRWIASWMMVVEDRVQHGSSALHPAILFTRVGPKQDRIGRYQLRLRERGRHVFGPIRLQTRFPLGLVERSYVMHYAGELLVHPSLGRLSSVWHREQLEADELVEQARPRHGAFEDEFHRLRDYRAGDSLRAIHWRTTARRNTLMVREYHQTRDRDLAIILDLWRPPQQTPAEAALIEQAIRFVATICVEHCQKSRESTIFLGVTGQAGRAFSGAAGPHSIGKVLDLLAMAELGDGKTLKDLSEQAAQLPTAHVRRLLVTTRLMRPNGGEVLASIQNEAHRHGTTWRVLPISADTLQRYFADEGLPDSGPKSAFSA